MNKRGDVLVVRQRDYSWSLPKGGIKKGEDPRDAAVREIVEESGLLHLRLIRILRSYTRYGMTNAGKENKDKLKRITMYLFETEDEELRPMDPRIAEARWEPVEKAGSLLTHPEDQEFFRQVMPEVKGVISVSGRSEA